jgi:hypothetical protein
MMGKKHERIAGVGRLGLLIVLLGVSALGAVGRSAPGAEGVYKPSPSAQQSMHAAPAQAVCNPCTF